MVQPIPTLLTIAVVTAIGLVVPAPPRTPGSTEGGCAAAWEVVPSPNVGRDGNNLGDVASIAPDDAWAMGSAGSLSARVPVALHWDGTSWSAVPAPGAPGKPVTWLVSVAAVATDDVWAVGYGADSSMSNSLDKTLALHWDGAAWSVVPTPNPQHDIGGGYAVSNRLLGVAAVAADDVWAVGESLNFSTRQTLVEHWNGRRWQVVRAPHPGDASRLLGVDAVAADDVWAVGTVSQHGSQHTLTLHWDGSTWTKVPSPDDGPYVQELLRVDASGADDVWAVGYHLSVFGVSQVYQTTTLHWDGAAWSVVNSPDVNERTNRLHDVVAIGADDAWTVGLWDSGTQLLGLTEHWDGSAWTIADSPSPGSYETELNGVDASPAGDVWAVGEQTDGLAPFQTLTLHRQAGCSASRVSSPAA